VQVQCNLSDIRSWFIDGVDEIPGVYRVFKAVVDGGFYLMIPAFENSCLELSLQYVSTSNTGIRKGGKMTAEEVGTFMEQVGMIQHEDTSFSNSVEGFLGQHQVIETAFGILSDNTSGLSRIKMTFRW
jgi:hypothetical protein